MKIQYYSELTKQNYESEADCKKAEDKYNAEIAEKEKKAKAKKNRAAEVEKIKAEYDKVCADVAQEINEARKKVEEIREAGYKRIQEAKQKYVEVFNKFVNDYEQPLHRSDYYADIDDVFATIVNMLFK